MKRGSRTTSISGLAALLLFGVFAVGILSVLLSGASAYRRLTQRDQSAYESRTCAQYVTAKLRQAPGPEAVSLAAFGEGDALVIEQEWGGELYWTRIYCHDGWLMELFTAAGGEFAPEDGEKILEAQSLSLERSGGLLTVELADGTGAAQEFSLYLRGGEEALP